jgi:hypothetical protein
MERLTQIISRDSSCHVQVLRHSASYPVSLNLTYEGTKDDRNEAYVKTEHKANESLNIYR